ncbi:MAG: L,D-transpeptidase [Microbacteriaceae bacterium]|nr:L,D-transpeptidase [Microbacteriaceae bacterium]
MSVLKKYLAAVGATALLVTLIGCSAAAAPTAPSASPSAVSSSAAQHSVAPVAAAKAAAVAPVVKPVAAAPVVPVTTTAAVACAGTPAGIKHIYVSIAQQHLWACTGTVLLTDGAVTTGASALTNVHNATPTGTMKITGKARNTVLAGKDVNGPWNDPVSYWMPFSGGVGFHDSPWQTFPLGSPLYTTQGSHGCVHLPLTVIAQVYDWAQIGTLVTIRA